MEDLTCKPKVSKMFACRETWDGSSSGLSIMILALRMLFRSWHVVAQISFRIWLKIKSRSMVIAAKPTASSARFSWPKICRLTR